MNWDWSFSVSILPQLLAGLATSIEAAVAGMAIALVLGLLLALGRRSRTRAVALPLKEAVEFFRTTPLLVQLFFLFYVLPQIGVTLPALLTGVIGLGLYYSAYTSEVYRAGIEAVPKGQWDAARALNLSGIRTMTDVVLPQAIPPMIPLLANYVIMAFKESSLLSTITVVELTQTANLIGSQTFHYFEPFTLVGLLYFLVSYPSALAVKFIQPRIRRAAMYSDG